MQAACAPRALLSPATASKTRIPATPPLDCRRLHGGGRVRILRSAVKCGGRGRPATELERKLEEEVAEMGILMRENCDDAESGGGVAELLECLEKEAIMGEDEGRQPSDYNRRALIFDTSSRIFQALKNRAAAEDDPSPDQGV